MQTGRQPPRHLAEIAIPLGAQHSLTEDVRSASGPAKVTDSPAICIGPKADVPRQQKVCGRFGCQTKEARASTLEESIVTHTARRTAPSPRSMRKLVTGAYASNPDDGLQVDRRRASRRWCFPEDHGVRQAVLELQHMSCWHGELQFVSVRRWLCYNHLE